MIKIRAMLMTSSFWACVNPGVINGISCPAVINAITIKAIMRMLIMLITVEILSKRSPLFFLYLINIGIKAELSAPVIKTSNTKSGRRYAARSKSSSSLTKNVAKVRLRMSPKNRDKIIIDDKIITEDNMSVCFWKMIFFVLSRILFMFSVRTVYHLSVVYFNEIA